MEDPLLKFRKPAAPADATPTRIRVIERAMAVRTIGAAGMEHVEAGQVVTVIADVAHSLVGQGLAELVDKETA